MKQYHSIAKDIILGQEVWIFDKLDGSNIRAEWDYKKGFTQFGSRYKIINKDTPVLGKSIAILKDREEIFKEIFNKNKIKDATIFNEFYGEYSSFGEHDEHTNSVFNVDLIDISANKKGLLYPKQFLEVVDNKIHMAKLLFHGILTQEIVDSIKAGTYLGVSYEGVIVKLATGTPGLPFMFKIKTDKWIADLKERCGDNIDLFHKLV